LAKALGGSGKVVLLTVPRQWNLEERVLGYQDALKNYPKIQIVGVLNDTSDPGRASAVVTEILHKHSDLRGIGCLDAAGGPGAVEAVKKAAKTPQVAIVAMG
jgi:ribose transport system substrate-binding protein